MQMNISMWQGKHIILSLICQHFHRLTIVIFLQCFKHDSCIFKTQHPYLSNAKKKPLILRKLNIHSKVREGSLLFIYLSEIIEDQLNQVCFQAKSRASKLFNNGNAKGTLLLESLSDTAKGRVYVFFLMITFYGKLSYTAFDIIYCCVRYIVCKPENTKINKKQQNLKKNQIKSN